MNLYNFFLLGRKMFSATFGEKKTGKETDSDRKMRLTTHNMTTQSFLMNATSNFSALLQ